MIYEQDKYVIDAYLKDIAKRDGKVVTKKKLDEKKLKVKKGDYVEDYYGNRHRVIDVSTDLDELESYDSTGMAREFADELESMGALDDDVLWVAVKDGKTTLVFVYGEDGVTLVEHAEPNENDKLCYSVVEAYYNTIKNDKSAFTFQEACDKKAMMTEKDVKSEKDLKEFGMALAKAVFKDEADEKIVNDIVKNAIEKATKDGKVDWGQAAGIVNASIGNE